ncbi:hypothetical protein [Hymenobacter antarcticus]|uniref:Uncharacterized protein n=1 Tax=Hymenobacter antarcticus TaxID=486270 RepID=A0ABP7PX91_9BACT
MKKWNKKINELNGLESNFIDSQIIVKNNGRNEAGIEKCWQVIGLKKSVGNCPKKEAVKGHCNKSRPPNHEVRVPNALLKEAGAKAKIQSSRRFSLPGKGANRQPRKRLRSSRQILRESRGVWI